MPRGGGRYVTVQDDHHGARQPRQGGNCRSRSRRRWPSASGAAGAPASCTARSTAQRAVDEDGGVRLATSWSAAR
jgi:hypothetical protein